MSPVEDLHNGACICRPFGKNETWAKVDDPGTENLDQDLPGRGPAPTVERLSHLSAGAVQN